MITLWVLSSVTTAMSSSYILLMMLLDGYFVENQLNEDVDGNVIWSKQIFNFQ